MNGQQLKNSILQLAIQGRLVPQDSKDEPASALLKRIREEKKRLVEEKKIKKEKPLAPIRDEEKPFDIPESWEWVRLGEVSNYGDIKKKNKISDSSLNIWSLDLEDIEKGGKLLKKVYLNERKSKGDRTLFKKGDILYSKLRPYLKKILIADEDGTCSTELVPFACYSNISHLYICYCLKSNYIDNYIASKSFGIKMPRVSTETMVNLLIPLPPLAEQHRIVEKIEELLPLVEEYDEAQKKLDKLNDELPEMLKKSVLQQAIMGKLDTRNDDDEPASVLLKRIKEEKAKLIKEKKLKKEKPLAPITDDEKPFDIPESWEWVRLGEITYNNGQKKPNNRFSYIDIGSINNSKQLLNTEEKILNANEAPSRARKIVKYGDILYSTVRPYLHNMCIINKDFSEEPIASTGFAVISCTQSLFNQFLFNFLRSPVFDEYANHGDNAKGIAYPAISDTKMNLALIPLPPLAEQHRIVDKIEEIIPLIDEMKKT